ncbi:MAG: FecCD family ABC transporter permease [Kofleriaceae bacterium]
MNRANGRRVIAGLVVALAVAMIVAIGYGPVSLSPLEVLAALARRAGFDVDASARDVAVVWSIRAPRVVLAALVGAGLATAGGALQGVVRNPLADPAIVGVSAGAALGAVAAFVLGARILRDPTLGPWLVPVAAFGGALVTTRIALAMARVEGATSGVTILLAGIGLAALCGAGIGVLLYLADDAALRSVTFWTLGSVGGATWALVGTAGVPIAVGVALLPRSAGDLDRLSLGDAEARHVGVDVDRTIRRVVLLVALAVGAAVAACGMISFVGLVVPFLVRAALGPGHRTLLPACALAGALVLVIADLVARTIVAPTEMPIGILTALVGAPILLYVVRGGRGARVMV